MSTRSSFLFEYSNRQDMLTLKMLRDDPERVIAKLAIKNFDAREIVEKVLTLDANRRSLQTESDALLATQKQLSAKVGALMREGKREEAEAVKKEVTELKAKSNELLAAAEANNKELDQTIVLLPNIPCDLVVPGKGAEDNQVVKMGGPEVHLPQDALPHWELAKKYDIIDFDLGVKISESREYTTTVTSNISLSAIFEQITISAVTTARPISAANTLMVRNE